MVTSYNGWLASPNPADFGGLAKLVVAGESFAPGVRFGDVHTVLQYVAEQLHARVEPVVRSDWHQADDWGYAYRANVNNPSQLSCHASGTAIDYNATRHPNGRANTFTAQQYAEIDKILREVDGVVRQLRGRDEMHFEVCAGLAPVNRVAVRLRKPPPPPPLKYPTIRRGDTGDAVKLIQRFLGVAREGDAGYGTFGPLTESRVIAYQAMKGLTPDGVVGRMTWAATQL
jgi:peptidoglycan hydrolase-like protein with peptidoglycan-binding domain